MKIRTQCKTTRIRPPSADLRLRDVNDVMVRINWVAEGGPQVELILQSEGSSTLVRMSTESAKSMGMRLIEESDNLLLTLRREYEQQHADPNRPHRSRALHRDFERRE